MKVSVPAIQTQLRFTATPQHICSLPACAAMHRLLEARLAISGVTSPAAQSEADTSTQRLLVIIAATLEGCAEVVLADASEWRQTKRTLQVDLLPRPPDCMDVAGRL